MHLHWCHLHLPQENPSSAVSREAGYIFWQGVGDSQSWCVQDLERETCFSEVESPSVRVTAPGSCLNRRESSSCLRAQEGEVGFTSGEGLLRKTAVVQWFCFVEIISSHEDANTHTANLKQQVSINLYFFFLPLNPGGGVRRPWWISLLHWKVVQQEWRNFFLFVWGIFCP